MSNTHVKRHPKKFAELRKPLDDKPARRERVREHKSAMLAELRQAMRADARSSPR
jgi:hypothetical protein